MRIQLSRKISQDGENEWRKQVSARAVRAAGQRHFSNALLVGNASAGIAEAAVSATFVRSVTAPDALSGGLAETTPILTRYVEL